MKRTRRRSPWLGALLVLAIGVFVLLLWPAREPRVLPPRPQPATTLERISAVVEEDGVVHAVYRLTNLASEALGIGVMATEFLNEDGDWIGPRGPFGPAFTSWNYYVDAGATQEFEVSVTNLLDRPWRVPVIISYHPKKGSWLENVGIIPTPRQSGDTAWIIYSDAEKGSE